MESYNSNADSNGTSNADGSSMSTSLLEDTQALVSANADNGETTTNVINPNTQIIIPVKFSHLYSSSLITFCWFVSYVDYVYMNMNWNDVTFQLRFISCAHVFAYKMLNVSTLVVSSIVEVTISSNSLFGQTSEINLFWKNIFGEKQFVFEQ